MASKTSQPVYVSNKTLDAIDAWLKTQNGKKLGMQDKAVGYILTKFIEDKT